MVSRLSLIPLKNSKVEGSVCLASLSSRLSLIPLKKDEVGGSAGVCLDTLLTLLCRAFNQSQQTFPWYNHLKRMEQSPTFNSVGRGLEDTIVAAKIIAAIAGVKLTILKVKGWYVEAAGLNEDKDFC